MLHAIIDIGSNTIRMAVYQIEGDAFTMLMKRKHTAGLAGCLADGRLTREGVDLTVRILGGFVDLIDALGISRVHAFATAALRTATNRAAVLAEIERRTGVRIRVLSGAEEAAYAFRGAAASIPPMRMASWRTSAAAARRLSPLWGARCRSGGVCRSVHSRCGAPM